MKALISALLIIPFIALQGFSQCTPDTTCTDLDEPGQICPDTLASGETGISYSEIVTILPPDSAQVSSQMIALYMIVIDTVTNMPPGLTYIAPSTNMYPDTSYCIEITGIPEQPGTYYLKITVIPYVYSTALNQVVAFPAQTDSTSLFITIDQGSSVFQHSINGFSLIQPIPNPFRDRTRLGIEVNTSEIYRLVVYDLAGKHIYTEEKEVNPGKNYFSFTGHDLSPGIYLYTVSDGKASYAGKLIKTR